MKTLESFLRKFAWLGLVSLCLTALVSTSSVAETLNYRLKWLFNASVIGDIYADVHGYFKEAGLDITVKPGGPERDSIKELELGQASFGVASADQVIRALSKGAPVVVIAQEGQAMPFDVDVEPVRLAGETVAEVLGEVRRQLVHLFPRQSPPQLDHHGSV